jgi:ElaB/YqjD/DUF883 family membrane-anchored ribosome-binding protein
MSIQVHLELMTDEQLLNLRSRNMEVLRVSREAAERMEKIVEQMTKEAIKRGLL